MLLKIFSKYCKSALSTYLSKIKPFSLFNSQRPYYKRNLWILSNINNLPRKKLSFEKEVMGKTYCVHHIQQSACHGPSSWGCTGTSRDGRLHQRRTEIIGKFIILKNFLYLGLPTHTFQSFMAKISIWFHKNKDTLLSK